MDLIERYIYAVGKRINKRRCGDIKEELKSLIMDELEAKKKGREPDEEEIAAVLKEMGPPFKVAMRYNEAERGLIRPALLEPYTLILCIVLGALTLGLFIATLIKIIQSPGETLILILQFAAQYISAAFGAVGGVTIVFAIIERVVPDYKKQSFGKDWDPRHLPEVPKTTDRVKIGDSIAAIVFIAIGFTLFNYFSDKIAIYYTPAAGEPLRCIPLLDANALLLYLPFLNILLGLSFIYHTVILSLGREYLWTRIFSIIMPILGIIMVALMLGGPSLLSSAFLTADFIPDTVKLYDILTHVYRGVLIVAIVGSVIEIIKKVYYLVKSAA